MKHLFIINPAAGSKDRTENYRKNILRVCEERGLAYAIHVSAGPGDCFRAAREAAETGEEYRLYACGGDGTLNEVAAAAAGYPNVAVTCYRGGSGNDFVRIFGDSDAFTDLERLLDCRETAFDMIRCNGDLSLNICSVGLDARIAADVAGYKRIPLLSGFRAYAVSTIVNLFRGIGQHCTVEINGERIHREFTMICVCNGRYYGGGFNPVPEADPCDGWLDVLLVKKVSLWQVPGLIGIYKNGRYKELPHLVRHLRTREIRILCDRETCVNLDGETRMEKDISMTLAEEKLRFFYPKELSWETPGVKI